MIARAIGSNTTARQAFEPSVVSLHCGGETCLATAPLAQSVHPAQPSVLLQTLDGSGSYRSRYWTASHGAANTTSFSNWMTGFSRTSAYRERSLAKLDGVTSQVGPTIGDCRILSMSGHTLHVRRRRVCLSLRIRRPPKREEDSGRGVDVRSKVQLVAYGVNSASGAGFVRVAARSAGYPNRSDQGPACFDD